MKFEDETESVLICDSCGYEVDIDDYGHEDDLDERYPTLEQVLDRDEDDEDSDDYGEYYDPDIDE